MSHKKQGSSDLYKKTDNIVELLDSHRDCYIEYQKACTRCRIELKPRTAAARAGKSAPTTSEESGSTNYRNFYVPPDIALLDKPEEQKKFRKEYLNEVGSRPDPKPITLLADTLHLEALNIVADRSNPAVLREELSAFFKRYAVQLQHKKYKMLGRWANQVTDSNKAEAPAVTFDALVGKLQKEFDSSLSRATRLALEDAYEDAINANSQSTRPQPTSNEQEGGKEGTLLYVEAPDKPIASAIRQDDIEVHMRIQNYRSQLFRFPEKLAASIKWLPYSKRFEIWKESRIQIMANKVQYDNQRDKVLQPVKTHVRKRLIEEGVADEKVLDHVCEKYTMHLEVEAFHNNHIAALNSHKATHEKPPFLFTSNVELKESLIPIAQEYGLHVRKRRDPEDEYNEDDREPDALSTDDGYHFSYQVQALWPAQFQQQVLAMQFDWHDTGEGTQADTDILLIQKLTQELGLDKNEMLAQMAKQAEIERNKSILGKIGKDQHSSESQAKAGKSGSTDGEQDDFARINLIRRIKEMKFFSLDETDYKLKKSDWLQYVCWLPNVSDSIKRQNFRLSNFAENPIDSLLLSAFEFIDVNEAGASNKILEDSATAHVRKVRSYFTDLSQKVQKTKYADKAEADRAILLNAASRDNSGSANHSPANEGLDEFINYNQGKVEEYLQNVDPLKQNLIKAYYTLRLLKSREIKAKMIQALNYFRGVQKRLAHDIREFYTRERALGGQKVEEALIGPQFGKDELGNLKAKKAGPAGPGDINANRIRRDLEDEEHLHRKPDGNVVNDPISIKGYKFNKRFNPITSSTCPCLPRYHTTFGRPTLYEEVSASMEKRDESWRFEAHPIVAYKDKLIFQEHGSDLLKSTIYVLDEHGIKIVYEESINDMLQLEEEMIKIGSFFLNKAELEEHTSPTESPSTMLDRGEVAHHLFEQELELQLTKVMLVETLLQVYEHTCDPLESVRLLQIVVDTMALRPRINLDATYFRDSYAAEIKVLKEKLQLYREVLHIQRANELAENQEIRKFQELKLRKLMDFLDGKWVYSHEPKMTEKMGQKEEYARGQGIEQARQGKRAQHLAEIQKQLALKEIAERHITEFAGDQHTDFAQVLGLPEVTASQLFKKQAQQDPIVIDAIREHSHFSKQIEGYPWFFDPNTARQLAPGGSGPMMGDVDGTGLQTGGAGLTDFFESFCSITRIHAACEQAFAELSVVHKPENGLAASCLEMAMLTEARGSLKVLRGQHEEGTHGFIKSANRLEEDFYLSSSDKLMFLMREFKGELHPDRISTRANPLLVSKLDISEVAKFNFPRLKQAEVEGYDELNDEQLTEKMIGLAKVSISRKYGEELEEVPEIGKKDEEEDEKDLIKSPSLMTLACNTVETLRLREELIQIVHETAVLSEIYSAQLRRTGRSTWKLVQRDPIQFETKLISRDNFNLVDYNDGTRVQHDLAFREYDATLGACLDFRSESCIKALMTNLGVEELRAVVHYQLLQRQLLTVAVMRNQTCMDGACQGLVELEELLTYKDEVTKLSHPITVPGAVINLKEVLSAAADGAHAQHAKREVQRLTSSLSKEIGDQMYGIEGQKSRHRQMVSKKYNVLYQRIVGTNQSIETKLRILRSYRLRLLHEYCQGVLKEAYQDAVTIQSLLACRELRWKSQLFPRDSNPFIVGQGALPEHLPRALLDDLITPEAAAANDAPDLAQLLNQRAQSVFYIPSSDEIVEAVKTAAVEEANTASSSATAVEVEHFEPEDVDKLVKELTKKPTIQTDNTNLPSNRSVTFKEAYSYESLQTELLRFFSQLLQIVSLEYLMGRNNAPGSQILDLEDSVYSGRPFWKEHLEIGQQETSPEDMAQQQRRSSAPDRVIAKIVNQKRRKMELSEDLRQIALRLGRMNEFVKASNSDQLRLSYINDLLKLQHQSSFLHFMNGLENALDIYLRHKSDANFSKVYEQLNTLARRDHGFNLLGNGLYLSQGSRNAKQVDPTSPMLRDHDQFAKCYQPIVDEQALVPPQIGLVRRLYGHAARVDPSTRAGALHLALPDYGEMNCSFLNMDDEQRANIATNFNLLEPAPDCDRLQGSVTEYLVWRGLIPDPAKERGANGAGGSKAGAKTILITRPQELLEARVEFFGLKVQARHLQRVLMSWLACRALPTDTSGYSAAQELFREYTTLKILLQRDLLIDQYNEAKSKHRGDKQEHTSATRLAQEKDKKTKATILESVRPEPAAHPIVVSLYQTKAEIAVAHRVLDVEMIKMSLKMIKNEHASLLAAFEQGAADGRVHAFVHPQQQFASTLYQSVDPNSHLNVVNKLDFVQSFLTKLRNRCTEVETLASGPGFVFSMKDFNECLHAFCQGLLKHCEAELRSRVETQHIRQNQYQHLLYMKEKSALYYRRKCEQFLGDIDKLVNAKISQKGGQLLYELDVSSRELRVLRDNYRLMQKMMTQELRHEYLRAIQEKDNQILSTSAALKDEKQRVSQTAYAEADAQFSELYEKLAAEGKITKPREAAGFASRAQPAGLHRGTLPSSRANLKASQNQGNRQFAEGASPEGAQEVGKFEAESIREVIGLQRYIRKHKALTMMKNVLAQERHEKELANQRAQLTSNAALWDQLAEAEKREQITKQELSLTKLSLASYEKLIEKLQGQLENLSNEKARLQQYKNSKSKRYEELVNKMKGLEILGNIDLDRILAELKSRDRKISELDIENKAQKDELAYVVHQQNFKAMQEMKKRLSHEREMKLQAYDRLEGLRVEMRALEGQDMKSDLWKDKCRELFDICKDLEQENDDLKSLVNDANQAHLLKAADEFEKAQGPNQFNSMNAMGQRWQDGRQPGGSKSTGPGSLGGRSDLASRGVDRVVSGRTLGAGGVGLARHLESRVQPGGVGLSQPTGTLLGGSSGFEGAASLHARPLTKKSGGEGDQVQSHFYPTQYDTVSENQQSRQLSGGQGPLHLQLAEAQELLSLGSGGALGEPTLSVGQPGAGASLAGGVFGPPLQSYAQPRGIMTAGGTSGGARPTHSGGGAAGQNRPSHLPVGAKRLQTSQGPRGAQAANSLTKPAARSSIYGAPSGKGTKGQPNLAASLQQRSRVHYSSHNSGSLAMAGMNIQGKGATVGGPNQGSYGAIMQRPMNVQHQNQAQPMNFNISFNTTNINVKK